MGAAGRSRAHGGSAHRGRTLRYAVEVRNCPEWEDPHGSSDPIPHERVFKFLNKPDSQALGRDVEEHRAVSRAFAQAE